MAVADGIVFDPLSISVEEIRHDAAYAGARVTLTRTLRGKSVWIGLGLCVLPVVFGLLALRLGDHLTGRLRG